MITRKFTFASLLVLLTFTSLGAATSTAFSQNVEELLKGEMQNFSLQKSPRELEDFSFVNGEGETVKLSDFRGKTLLLNFWATWCAPCRKEMPGLDRLQAQLGSDKFTVLAIGQDLRGIERVKKFMKALEIKHLENFNDKTTKSGRSAGVFGLPASILVNAQGQDVGRLVGPAEWDSEEAIALIQHFMSASVSSTGS